MEDQIFEDSSRHILKLNQIADSSGELMEGNCFYYHRSEHHVEFPHSRIKRTNLVRCAQRSARIMEIGFNAGHSCLLMLQSNPNCSVTCFDLGEHSYTVPCYEYLKQEFGENRVKLIVGSSEITVPQFKKDNPGVSFDMIHIDGAHDQRLANLDFWNSASLGEKGSLVIFDDTDMPTLNDLWMGFVNGGTVRVDDSFMEKTNAHSIGRWV